MSSDDEYVYECDCCTWLLRVPPDTGLSDVEAEFNGHDCKINSLKNISRLKNNH